MERVEKTLIFYLKSLRFAICVLPKYQLGILRIMKKSNQFASPFSAWSGHRLFHVVAGTLIGAMVVTQASAMLPTPEQAVDSSMAMQASASGNSSAQAVNSKITASLVSVDANGQETLVPVDTNTRLQSGPDVSTAILSTGATVSF